MTRWLPASRNRPTSFTTASGSELTHSMKLENSAERRSSLANTAMHEKKWMQGETAAGSRSHSQYILTTPESLRPIQ